MKAKICIALLALAASFNATAQDAALDVMDPTDLCMQALAADPQFAGIADKIALGAPALQRVANAQERTALAAWQALRTECFEAGEPYRSIVLTPRAQALAKSSFISQQRAVSDLREGRTSYAEFNRRRVELARGPGAKI